MRAQGDVSELISPAKRIVITVLTSAYCVATAYIAANDHVETNALLVGLPIVVGLTFLLLDVFLAYLFLLFALFLTGLIWWWNQAQISPSSVLIWSLLLGAIAGFCYSFRLRILERRKRVHREHVYREICHRILHDRVAGSLAVLMKKIELEQMKFPAGNRGAPPYRKWIDQLSDTLKVIRDFIEIRLDVFQFVEHGGLSLDAQELLELLNALDFKLESEIHGCPADLSAVNRVLAESVFQELLINVLKHGDSKGLVRISGKFVEGQTSLRVENSIRCVPNLKYGGKGLLEIEGKVKRVQARFNSRSENGIWIAEFENGNMGV